jgi:hypothetical protein
MKKIIYTTDTKYVPSPGWYYYDIQFKFRHGPFNSEDDATEAYEEYINKVSFNRLMVVDA